MYSIFGEKEAKEGHHLFEISDNDDPFLDPRDDLREKLAHTAEVVKDLQVAGRVLKVGTNLSRDQEARLSQLLKDNLDLFAWTIKDVPRIDPSFLCHQLTISPDAKAVVQKKRKMGKEKMKGILQKTKDWKVS